MGKSIQISDALAVDALQVAEQRHCTISAQIEHWAQLGKMVEPFLKTTPASSQGEVGSAASLSELLASVDAPEGRQRTFEHLAKQPFPHFEAAPGEPGYLVRIEADGSRTVGRFVDRTFIAKPAE